MADLIENEPCYIYHVRDYQENSQIIEALSLNYGALTILAQGSKKANSPTKGLFQPFIPLKLSLKKSRTELYFLTGYEHAGNGFDFKMPYYFCASYINELLHHIYHNKDADVALFGSYIETLEAIRDKNGIESHLRNFELTLLKSLGYSLSTYDDEGALLSFKDKYRFCFGLGFIKYDEKLLSYVTSQYKRSASFTNSSYANSCSSYHKEEDDGMLFSKSKVRGRRLESNIAHGSYGVSYMGFESSQYQSNFDSEQSELLQKYSEYLQDFLGPILNGAQIRDIIDRSFALPDAARNAKQLTSSIINKLLGGREIKSRRLYREYVELKIKQKAQMQEQAKDATSYAHDNKLISDKQVNDNNLTVGAPSSDNIFNRAVQEHNVNTPEAYLNYALQSRALANSSFISDDMNQAVSQSINGEQLVAVKTPYKRYVAQFKVKAEQASNDYEDIPEFNAVSENNFTIENSNEFLLNVIATTSDSTAKLETSYQDELSNLSDFNLDKAAVAKEYDQSKSDSELSLHCEAKSLEEHNTTLSPAPNTQDINSKTAIDIYPKTDQQEAIEQNQVQDISESNIKLNSNKSLNDTSKDKAKVESQDSSKSKLKSKENNIDKKLHSSNSTDKKLGPTNHTDTSRVKANSKVKDKAKVESQDSSKSKLKSKENNIDKKLHSSNSTDKKLDSTNLNDTSKGKANSKVKAKATVESQDSSKSESKSKDFSKLSSSTSKVLKRSLAKDKIKGPNGLLVAESAEDLLLGKSKNKTLLIGPKASKSKSKAKVKRSLKVDRTEDNHFIKDKQEPQDGVLLQNWLFDLGAGD